MNEINNDMNESNISESNISENNISESNVNEENNSTKKNNGAPAWIIIALLAIVGVVGGFFIGKAIVNKKHIDTAKEYIANHEHTFKEATCLEAKICTDCGYTEGEALGHDFLEATCEILSTCSRCGCTQGEYAEHDFAPANLETAKTCKVCDQTEGEPVKLKIFTDSDIDETLKTEKLPEDTYGYFLPLNNDTYLISVKLPNELWWERRIVDAFSDEIRYTVAYSDLLSLFPNGLPQNYPVCFVNFQSNPDGASVMIFYGSKLRGIDDHGQQVFEIDTKLDISKGFFYDETLVYGDEAILMICSQDISTNEYSVSYFSTLTGESISEPSVPEPKKLEGFDDCAYQEGLDIYLVSRNNEWGYADAEGNIISMYMDATGFNAAGYALVSDDCVTYDLIDTDFNVIATDVVSGKSASVYGGITEGSYWFKVTDENDLNDFVLIK